MRVYLGRRDERGKAQLFVRDTNGDRQYEIVQRPDRDTDDVEWGYVGTGPRNAANAILADLLGHIPAWVEAFEREIVANQEPEFELSTHEIDGWMRRHGYH